MMSSILQPFTGFYADRHPRPYALAIGMCFTLAGLLSLAFAGTFSLIILSVSLIGLGSSVFHPEASRVAQMASGGKKVLRSQSFKLAETEEMPSARSLRHSWYNRSASAQSAGSRLWLS